MDKNLYKDGTVYPIENKKELATKRTGMRVFPAHYSITDDMIQILEEHLKGVMTKCEKYGRNMGEILRVSWGLKTNTIISITTRTMTKKIVKNFSFPLRNGKLKSSIFLNEM